MPVLARRCRSLCSRYLIGQQSGLAKANPLSMHNKTLIPTRCTAATLGRDGGRGYRRRMALPERFRAGLVEGLCRARQPGHICRPPGWPAAGRPRPSATRPNPQGQTVEGPTLMSGALKLEFASFRNARQGRSRCVLRGGAQVRRRRPPGDRADRRSGRAGRGGRPVQGQERLRARHRGAARARGLAPDRGWGRQGARPQGAGFRQARRHRHGRDPGGGERGDHRRRPAGRRHQAGADRRHRARRASCAPMPSSATRPSARRARRRRRRSRSRSRSPASRRWRRRSRRAARWRTAW